MKIEKIKSQIETSNHYIQRAEKISFYAILGFFIMFLIWVWCYAESKNEIRSLNKNHILEIDSLNYKIQELEIQLDTIHNNASKIPDENFKN